MLNNYKLLQPIHFHDGFVERFVQFQMLFICNEFFMELQNTAVISNSWTGLRFFWIEVMNFSYGFINQRNEKPKRNVLRIRDFFSPCKKMIHEIAGENSG